MTSEISFVVSNRADTFTCSMVLSTITGTGCTELCLDQSNNIVEVPIELDNEEYERNNIVSGSIVKAVETTDNTILYGVVEEAYSEEGLYGVRFAVPTPNSDICLFATQVLDKRAQPLLQWCELADITQVRVIACIVRPYVSRIIAMDGNNDWDIPSDVIYQLFSRVVPAYPSLFEGYRTHKTVIPRAATAVVGLDKKGRLLTRSSSKFLDIRLLS